MSELGCQTRVSERAWKISDIRERIFQALRRKLQVAGAHDIDISPPLHVYVDGFVDEEGDWHPIDKPYWVWDITAIGQADG